MPTAWTKNDNSITADKEIQSSNGQFWTKLEISAQVNMIPENISTVGGTVVVSDKWAKLKILLIFSLTVASPTEEAYEINDWVNNKFLKF